MRTRRLFLLDPSDQITNRQTAAFQQAADWALDHAQIKHPDGTATGVMFLPEFGDVLFRVVNRGYGITLGANGNVSVIFSKLDDVLEIVPSVIVTLMPMHVRGEKLIAHSIHLNQAAAGSEFPSGLGDAIADAFVGKLL
ncbi:hypothetical protein Sp245p_29005 (plasmid) [Azospirillum baldaniorum]|uniref:Uncharacterized protein n=1 Tax=Azospirillum baldaniorum TaxID=1064539 RepID=A0A9P1JY86_9PROT|nr:hypothetical protein [Azospirillum baldaniorum]AWJ94286.1 hypothetical protein Sp245p_29005 [Azospirillum baldaniorum]TWA81686.1 hypothetical protein FBZ85_10260 [Azospirillum brasilense]CCD02022.1 protein of unknown function [Azospirillum baldaniorum]